jgi:hypothetical protein
MNIFVLHDDPYWAALYHCDKHVPKMILESAQMLSTVMGGPYLPTHKNHPCTLWVAESYANAHWLWLLAKNLNNEYRKRFNHEYDHKSWQAIKHLAMLMPNYLPDEPMTPFAQAMPDEYKNDDAVTAYRAYYRSKSFAEWRNGAPAWW